MATTPTQPVQPPATVPLPSPPTLSDPDNFDERGDAFVLALSPFRLAMNALADNAYTNALVVFGKADSASASATTATEQASQAKGFRDTARDHSNAASVSADVAASAASAAVLAVTDIQKYYLGPKPAHPATSNQGGPLVVGTWYTNTTNGAWFWWGGPVAGWKLGMSDVNGQFVPMAGGVKLGGFLSGPQGASGEQFPQAQEVIPRVSMQPSGKSLRTIVTSGFHRLDTYSDGPPGVDLSYGQLVVSRGGDTAFQLGVPYNELGGPLVFRRGNPTEVGGTGSYGPWQQLLSSLWFVEQVKASTVPAGTGSYAVNPGEGSVHYVAINGAVTFNLPAQGRQLGDQVTLRVISSGAVRPISFSANVRMPSGQSFPTYAADQVVTLVLFYGRQNVWDCFFAGVHSA